GIGGVDAVDVGPNDELVGINDMRDNSTGEIGAVAAKRGDAAVGSGADKAGDHRDNAGFEEREENAAATLSGLFEVGLRVAKSVASQHKFRGRERNGGDAELF